MRWVLPGTAGTTAGSAPGPGPHRRSPHQVAGLRLRVRPMRLAMAAPCRPDPRARGQARPCPDGSDADPARMARRGQGRNRTGRSESHPTPSVTYLAIMICSALETRTQSMGSVREGVFFQGRGRERRQGSAPSARQAATRRGASSRPRPTGVMLSINCFFQCDMALYCPICINGK